MRRFTPTHPRARLLRLILLHRSSTPHPKLPGTIHTAVEEVEKAGGKGLPLVVDIRHEDQVEEVSGASQSLWKM